MVHYVFVSHAMPQTENTIGFPPIVSYVSAVSAKPTLPPADILLINLCAQNHVVSDRRKQPQCPRNM